MRGKQAENKQRNLVGPALRIARLEAGLSQEKVVERLELEHGIKMDRSALTRIENQQRGIDDFEVFGLAKIYLIEIGTLFPQEL